MLSAFAMNYLLLAQEVGLSLAAKNFACKFQNLFYRLCCYGYLLLACKGLFTYTTQKFNHSACGESKGFQCQFRPIIRTITFHSVLLDFCKN